MHVLDLLVKPLPCYYRAAMLSMKLLIRFLDRGFLIKLLLTLMLYSLVPIGEFFLLLIVRDYIGPYLTVAAVTATALFGLAFASRSLSSVLREVHRSIDAGYYPEESLRDLAGVLIAALLVLTPGFVTDFLGFVFFVPFLRRFVGRIAIRPMRARLKELYEYVKLYDE